MYCLCINNRNYQDQFKIDGVYKADTSHLNNYTFKVLNDKNEWILVHKSDFKIIVKCRYNKGDEGTLTLDKFYLILRNADDPNSFYIVNDKGLQQKVRSKNFQHLTEADMRIKKLLELVK